jgi:hypothetical protein
MKRTKGPIEVQLMQANLDITAWSRMRTTPSTKCRSTPGRSEELSGN